MRLVSGKEATEDTSIDFDCFDYLSCPDLAADPGFADLAADVSSASLILF